MSSTFSKTISFSLVTLLVFATIGTGPGFAADLHSRLDDTAIAEDVALNPFRSSVSPRFERVESRNPFEAAALSWTTGMSDVTVRMRASVDGVAWTEWKVANIDSDLTDVTEGRFFTSIVHFGGALRHVEYELSSTAAGVPINALSLTTFAPPPSRSTARLRSNSLRLGEVEVRSRIDWNCPDGSSSRWTPTYTKVTHEVVHHTAGANNVPDWEAEVRNIWYFHTVTRAWGDVGYNYLIDPNGVIYEGRAGGDGALGAHFSCRNTNTTGVSLLGTFTGVPPTAAALESLKRLLRELSARYGVVPGTIVRHTPTGLDLPTILTHRDGNPSPAVCTTTTCPGDALYALMPSIRESAAACVSPSIAVQPSSQSIVPGSSASLQIAAAGTSPMTFQWYVGSRGHTGEPVTGANVASMSVSPAATTTYWVRITNACGTVDSLESQVSVGRGNRRRTVR
ncbi:MAG TPA: N-acetylmuramoyl-L-alanine amidase [Thermoanaerobaculia bacterium]|nr:N-acetylmuramoyl-L-alanine amidase [Thermoanaerobaculia bacterium]